MWNLKPSLRFEINNFSQKEAPITSNLFVSGGCEWSVTVYPKGDYTVDDDHLSLLLSVGNSISLRTGWERSANYYFVLLNQSNKELYRSSIGVASNVFCNETPSASFRKTLPLSKFQDKGFLENDILIIEVYIKLIKVFDGEEDENVSNKKKKNTMDINGFRVLDSQVTSVKELFAEHPDIAVDIRTNIKEVKTTYMNILLGLIETLDKPSQSLSEAELSNADSDLKELTGEGFKLNWLKLKLEEVSLERKKEVSDRLDQNIENVELTLSGVKAKDDDKVDHKEKMNSACDDVASAKVSSFQLIDAFVKRCFLSCFSISQVRD